MREADAERRFARADRLSCKSRLTAPECRVTFATMKAVHLTALWSVPDNGRLTSKQFSFRLPVHVAAKLAALEEMYPTRTRTQLVGDLLAAALAELEAGLPSVEGRKVGVDPDTHEEIFEEIGQVSRYRELANKHFAAIEKDLGNDKPGKLY